MEIHEHWQTKLIFHTCITLMQSDCELEMYMPDFLKWLCWCVALCRQTLRFELVLQQLLKSNLNFKQNKTMKGAL